VIQLTEKEDSIIFSVSIVPRASKSEVVGEHDGALKIRIAAPPVGGAANAELIRILSKEFDVSKSAVEIMTGQTSKRKQVKISGVKSAALTKAGFLDLI
jgi:hypothetical protein